MSDSPGNPVSPLRRSLERAAAPAVDPAAAAAEYARRREEDWERFAAGPDRLPNRWARWEEQTHGWKQRVAFFQPLGIDAPEVFAPLDSLLAELGEMEEIEIPPRESLYLNIVTIGHLMSTDVMWSQVETCRSAQHRASSKPSAILAS